MLLTKYSHKCVVFVIYLNVIVLCGTTLSPKSPKHNKEPKNKVEKISVGPVPATVFERSLLVETPTAKDILNNHQSYSKHTHNYHFHAMVLGYVTPWNNHGYDIAKIFGNKFTHISPVWLQVKCKGQGQYEITGLHDVDENWMNAVLSAGNDRGVQIVPRILFDGWSGPDYVYLLGSNAAVKALAKVFVKICTRYHFDGLVVELWSQLASAVPHDQLVNLIQNIGNGQLSTIFRSPKGGSMSKQMK